MTVETDSYMYQSVGSDAVPLIAEALDIPLVLRRIEGEPQDDTLNYDKGEENDEVEDLYALLKQCIVGGMIDLRT